MKTSILTITLVLTQVFVTYASLGCIWVSSKNGITIYYVSDCDEQNQIFIDSVVNQAVLKLDRQDTSLKVHAFVNFSRLSFPGNEHSNFYSIGYDTLRWLDEDFIFSHYKAQEEMSINFNKYGSNSFNSQIMPLDINATNHNTINEKGIKIIYNKDYDLGEPAWMDIIKSIEYAAINVDSIKMQQRRDTVRINYNGWYVSLVTIDTNHINRILGKEPANIESHNVNSKTNIIYYLVGAIALLVTLSLLYTRKKESNI